MNDPIATLVDRLNAGWAMCERETYPKRRERLEAHWIALLREYEAACDAADMIEGVAA